MASIATAISFLSLTIAACIVGMWAIERRKAKHYCQHGRRLGHYCEPCTESILLVMEREPKRVIWGLEDL